MDQDSIFLGLDVHKEHIAVALANGRGGAPQPLSVIPSTPEAVRKLLHRYHPLHRIVCAYEAGPCGYALYRQVTSLGARCVVVAPSLIPTKPGDRVKTNRRDALKLARLLRSGELTPVWVPDEAHEALRDLTRAREDARFDLVRARHRLTKLLLRLGLVPSAGVKAWTRRYRQWLESLCLPYPSQQTVLREYLIAIVQAEDRIQRLDQEIADAAQTSPHAALIAALQTLRGIALIHAVTLVAELGDLTRFPTPRQLMAYVGVVPREASTGNRAHRGPITKTGNAHIRYTIVEAAWHYRHPPGVWGKLRRRQQGQPPAITSIAWRAQERLYRRYRRLVGRGKSSQEAIVAVARELLGFIWALAREVAPPRAA